MLTDTPPPPFPPVPDFEVRIQGKNLADASSMGAKAMYELINNGKSTESTARQRWQEDREAISISNDEEWKDTCESPFRATRETKLRSLHYKIIHRTFPCGSYLHRVRITDSDWCKYCDETDSITHFLFSCTRVQPFWISICEWFRREVDLYLDKLTAKEFIFGLAKGTHLRDVINDILLFTKFYIFRQKNYHDCNLDTRNWLLEFKTRLRIEFWIRKRTGARAPSRIHNRILEALG